VQEFRVAPPYWKGYLKLALVSCPIAVYTAASSTEKVAFRQVNRQTGHRIRQSLVDEVTKQPVATADKARGYEVDKDVYLVVEDEELDSIAIESTHTIDIDSFVPHEQIDDRYFDQPYYIAPNDRVGQEAFVTIRDAMQHKGVVALGRVVMNKRERVIMLQPWDKGLLGTSLRYAYEVRDPALYFADIDTLAIKKDLMAMAEQIVESRKSDFDPAQFRDRYEEAVVEMLERKKAGMPPSASRPADRGGGVIDFAEALRRSMQATGKNNAKAGDAKAADTKAADTKASTAKAGVKAGAASPAKSKKTKKRIEGQGEMLLPIAGGGQAKQAARKAAATGRSKKAS
jgi:DNA end-binding protein Ku